jgi:hypothetical protein
MGIAARVIAVFTSAGGTRQPRIAPGREPTIQYDYRQVPSFGLPQNAVRDLASFLCRFPVDDQRALPSKLPKQLTHVAAAGRTRQVYRASDMALLELSFVASVGEQYVIATAKR